MALFDISVPIEPGMPVYPGDPPVTLTRSHSIEQGDAANVTSLEFGSHTGTHIDAPRHFLQDGTPVDLLPLDLLVGEALVVEVRGTPSIGPAELERLPLQGVERLLLKTENSSLWGAGTFRSDYVSLSAEGAAVLVRAGVRLVGVDYLSVERFQGDGCTHRTLLEHGVVIVEGLNLSDIAPGRYELLCLPLRISGGDGAPARVLLRR